MRHEILGHVTPDREAERKRAAAWWVRLTPAQREELIHRYNASEAGAFYPIRDLSARWSADALIVMQRLSENKL